MKNIVEDFIRCKKYIDAALEYTKGTHSISDIWNGIVNGSFQFWPGERSAVVTEIQIFPQRKIMHIFLAGGDLDELLEMENSVRAYAETIGCNSMSISGRRGWVRIFESQGWKEVSTTVAKEL